MRRCITIAVLVFYCFQGRDKCDNMHRLGERIHNIISIQKSSFARTGIFLLFGSNHTYFTTKMQSKKVTDLSRTTFFVICQMRSKKVRSHKKIEPPIEPPN